jgi:N-acetylmuramoyl-L-alanine amidase
MKRIDKPSPNFEARPANSSIDMLVIHYTGMASGKAALDQLCDPAAGVSAHYLIDEDGTLYCLVDETTRAWHAGLSSWRGNSDINDRSIGVELVNPGHNFGYRAFPDPQMETAIALAQDIVTCHPIPPRNVVAHSDIAPLRKLDPGE